MKRLYQKGFTILEVLIILASFSLLLAVYNTVDDKTQELLSKHPTHMTNR